MDFNENEIPTVEAEIVEEGINLASGGTSPNPPQKPKKGSWGKKIFIALIIVILLIAGIATAIELESDRENSGKDKDTSSIDSSAQFDISDSKEYEAASNGDVLTSVEIAEKVKPSVIAVVTYSGSSERGEGSGVVMSEDKEGYTYILTCAHIVSTRGISVKVELEDGTQYDADVVGYDTRTDIAVLRVKGTGFTVAEFGDSSVLKVGEPVYAIGNPGGTAFYGSFTGGYVSAIDRPTSSSSSSYTMECIQHDAAINPGNSGGALVNSYGQVIGINSSKIASESYEGMGFAIPINVAKEVVDSILENGYVANRAKLGISYMPVSQNQTYSMIAKVNNLPAGSIIIAEIESESVFKGTGVEAGDLIVAVNGDDLTSSNILLSKIEKSSVGDKLTLTIVSINKDYSIEKRDVEITLIEDKGGSTSTTEKSSENDDFTNPFAQEYK